jgi:N-acetyl-anhydromuramyl-L-alanine amidase AmpD
MLSYKLRSETTAVVLHDAHVPASQSNLENFLAVGGRERGLLDVGYHYLILQDGRVVDCRPHTVQGTHLRSKKNRETIGVCLAGGRREHPEVDELGMVHMVPEDNFTPDQWHSLTLLMHTLRKHYGPLPLVGHSEIDPRHHGACPPVDMAEIRDRCLTP